MHIHFKCNRNKVIRTLTWKCFISIMFPLSYKISLHRCSTEFENFRNFCNFKTYYKTQHLSHIAYFNSVFKLGSFDPWVFITFCTITDIHRRL